MDKKFKVFLIVALLLCFLVFLYLRRENSKENFECVKIDKSLFCPVEKSDIDKFRSDQDNNYNSDHTLSLSEQAQLSNTLKKELSGCQKISQNTNSEIINSDLTVYETFIPNKTKVVFSSFEKSVLSLYLRNGVSITLCNEILKFLNASC